MADADSYVARRAALVTQQTRDILRQLPECCAEFLFDIEPTTTPLTRLAYARDLALFFHFLVKEIPRFADAQICALTPNDLENVTARHVAQFSEYLTLYCREDDTQITNGELGRMRKLSSVRSFFNDLFTHERITKNVTEKVPLPKLHEKAILRLEPDEVSRLLDAADTGDALSARQQKWHEHTRLRDLAMLMLFLGTGIRVSELVGLDLDELDFEVNGMIVRRKGGDEVFLYFSDEVAEALKAYIEQRNTIEAAESDRSALFLSTQKRRISPRAVEQLVKKYATVAAPLKKRISPHKLRSTFGTELYKETGDIYLVADVLGHSDVNTTRRHYAAMAEDNRRKAAKAVKLRDDPKPKTD